MLNGKQEKTLKDKRGKKRLFAGLIFFFILTIVMVAYFVVAAEGDYFTSWTPGDGDWDTTDDGTYLWISDDAKNGLYKHYMNGTYTGTSIDVSNEMTSAAGVFYYGGYFWVGCYDNDEVYKYYANGTYTETHFDIAGSGNENSGGMATDGTYIWIADETDDDIYKYWLNGTYNTKLDTEGTGLTGVAYYNNYLWSYDVNDDEVYKYYDNGTYTQSHFDTGASGCGSGLGVHTNGAYFWIYDWADDLVYVYKVLPITFSTVTVEGVHVAPIDDNILAVGWYDYTEADISFAIYYTNGTLITSEVDVDSDVGQYGYLYTPVSISAFNSTHFVIGYYDYASLDTTYATYDIYGTKLAGPVDVETSGYGYSVSVSALNSTAFVIGYYDLADSRGACFEVHDVEGNEITSKVEVDESTGIYSQSVSVSALNDTHFVFAWIDASDDDATFGVYDIDGTAIAGPIDADTDVGDDNSKGVSVSVLDSDKFVIGWQDGTDDDVSFAVYYTNGTIITSETDVDTSRGSSSYAVEVSAINTTAFMIVWRNNDEDDATFGVYDIYGNEITAPTDASTDISSWTAGKSSEYATEIGFCDDNFLITYVNSDYDGVWEAFYTNGTVWNGVCLEGDTPPTVTLNSPLDTTKFTSSYQPNFNCSGFDDVNFTSMTFYWNVSGDFIANGTNSSGINDTYYIFDRDVNTYGDFVWNCYGCDNSSNCAFADANRTFSYHYRELTISDPTTANPELVSSWDNITILFNYSSDGINQTSGVTLNSVFIEGIEAEVVTSSSESTYITSSIAQDSDDAEEDTDDGYTDIASSDLEITYEGEDQVVGLRFQDVNIPQGATISLAKIEFQCDEATSGAGTVYIYGQDADDTTTFTGGIAGTYGVTGGRTFTSNYATWTWDEAWTDPNKYNSTDISNVVQEIVDREGWTANNAMVFMINSSITSNANSRIAEDYDVYPAKLYIAYSTEADEFAFTDGNWNVNVTVPDFVGGLKDLFINATYSGIKKSNTQTDAIDYGGDPNVTAISPQNITYDTSSILFNASVTSFDFFIDKCQYSLDDAANVSLTNLFIYDEGNYRGDYFEIAKGVNDYAYGITQNGTFIWITDVEDFEVYKYYMNGTYTQDHWDTEASGNIYPMGMTNNNTFIWVIDFTPPFAVYKHYMNGTYTQDNFTTAAAWPLGITQNGTFFWTLHGGNNDLIYKYYMNGTYTQENFNASLDVSITPEGMTTNGTFIWILDNRIGDDVYKYYMNGTYTQEHWDLGESGNEHAFDITQNESFFWITDMYQGKVYRYYHMEQGPSDYWNKTSTVGYGQHDVVFYCNNTNSQWDASEKVYFYINDTRPNVTVNSPQNITYNTTSILFNATATSPSSSIDTCQYSLDDEVNVSLIREYLYEEGDYTEIHWDTLESAEGITQNGTFFWITDSSSDEVYKYHMNGTYTKDHWDLYGDGILAPQGITQNNTFFWITDLYEDEVYKYYMNGTYTGDSFDTSGSGNEAPIGITQNGTFFWIVDSADSEVYKYYFNGTYTEEHWDITESGVGSALGGTQNNTFFWIADYSGGVYKYYLNGTYTGYVSATQGNPYAMTQNGTFFWISSGSEVYQYYMGSSYLDFWTKTSTVGYGQHDVLFYCNDTNSEWGVSEKVYFYINDTRPNVTVNSPQNITYNTTSILFNATATSPSSSIDTCQYSLDDEVNVSLIKEFLYGEGDYTDFSFDTYESGNEDGGDITQNGTFIWITDVADMEVYKYYMNGTYTQDHFDTWVGSGNNYPTGITNNNTYLWIIDYDSGKVNKHYINGTYAGEYWNTAAESTNPYSITQNNTFFWIVHGGDNKVYKYYMNGTYTGDSFNISNAHPFGIIQNGTYFWITDYYMDEVYKYYMNGTYTGEHFYIAGSGNKNAKGITMDGTYFWIVDSSEEEVYKYWVDDGYSNFWTKTSTVGYGQHDVLFYCNDTNSEWGVSEKVYFYINDTCTYSSGNWEVDCVNYCNITSNVALGGNNISITGTGGFTTTANISDYNVLYIEGTNSTNICTVRCLNAGCFKE